MEIKKADSKGRVSGFEPGAYYTVVRGHTGTGFALNQVDTSKADEISELHGDLASRDELRGGDYLNRLNRLGNYSE